MSNEEVFRNAKLSIPLNEWGLDPFNRQQRPLQQQTQSLKPQHAWSLDAFDRQARVKSIFSRVQGSRYPIKLLRYWFMYNLLQAEAERLGRPLRICEIGVDLGQMRLFAQDAGFSQIACWDAVDVKPRPELQSIGYDSILKLNAEDPGFRLEQRYDVVIALHLLEHLYEPEVALGRFSEALVQGGIVMGGYPVTPKVFSGFWQKRLRKNARPFHHVSVFSPERTIKMAARNGMKIDFMSGAFLMRRTGSFLENYRFWMRWNLHFGACFPSLGGELYWSMRKE
jgi:hypothetical protein